MGRYYYADRNRPWIPDQWFLGIHHNRGGEEPLGFMTPDGDDSQAESRKDTARKWATPGRFGGKFGKKSGDAEFRTLESEPQSGYKVASVTKRGGRESNRELFRVVDPRGFELEIDPENFLKIMRNTFVEKGEIFTELAWVRAGSNNLLIPTDSEEYDEALKETEARKSDLGMGDIELGWRVRIQRGMEGRYLGRWDLIQRERTRKRSRTKSGLHHAYEYETDVEVNTNRRYAFLNEEKNVLIVHGSPDPAEVLSEDGITYEEAAEIVNENVDLASRGGSGSLHSVVGFTRDRGDSLTAERTGGNSVEVTWNTGESEKTFTGYVDT